MTTDGKPVAVEGNIVDIDPDAKFFTLEGRDGKVFLKVFWKPAHDAKMIKQKPGYYEAPVVEMEEHTGGLQEAVLIDLPWKERPADFPRSQRQQGGGNKGGGRPYQPRNERAIIMQVVFKEACEVARQFSKLSADFDEESANVAFEWAIKKTEESMDRLCKAGGV